DKAGKKPEKGQVFEALKAALAERSMEDRAEPIAFYHLRQALAAYAERPEMEVKRTDALHSYIASKDWHDLPLIVPQQLPRLRTPAWFQHLAGALFLGGMVLPFFFPLPGLGLFLGSILLIWIAERYWKTFSPADLGSAARRTVLLNPLLYHYAETLDTEILAVFEERWQYHFGPELEPESEVT
ncbi:MAG: hypothetical protein AAF570_21570, partial [Bacteroidota bacterium]